MDGRMTYARVLSHGKAVGVGLLRNEFCDGFNISTTIIDVLEDYVSLA